MRNRRNRDAQLPQQPTATNPEQTEEGRVASTDDPAIPAVPLSPNPTAPELVPRRQRAPRVPRVRAAIQPPTAEPTVQAKPLETPSLNRAQEDTARELTEASRRLAVLRQGLDAAEHELAETQRRREAVGQELEEVTRRRETAAQELRAVEKELQDVCKLTEAATAQIVAQVRDVQERAEEARTAVQARLLEAEELRQSWPEAREQSRAVLTEAAGVYDECQTAATLLAESRQRLQQEMEQAAARDRTGESAAAEFHQLWPTLREQMRQAFEEVVALRKACHSAEVQLQDAGEQIKLISSEARNSAANLARIAANGKTSASAPAEAKPASPSVETTPHDPRGPLGLIVDAQAVVLEIVPDSPAERAGLRVGDRITATDGEPVLDSVDVIRAVEEAERHDESISLTLARGDERVGIVIHFATEPALT